MKTTASRLLPALGVIVLAFSGGSWSESSASALPAPTDPQVTYVINSSPPEIGITDIYSNRTDVIDVAAAGGAVDPVMAPDGAKIAFSWHCGLYTVNTDGSNLSALPNSTGACAEKPAWSPSSARLAFDAYSQNNQAVWTSSSDGSDQVEIAPGGQRPSWSPDGTRIAFIGVSDHYALETIAASGGSATVLVSLAPGIGINGSYLASVAWSPDGNTIAYVKGFDVGGLPGGGALAFVNANGTDNRVVGGALGNQFGAFGITWCPNGRCLLSQFGGGSQDPSNTMLDMFDVNGSLSSSLTVDGDDASFIGVAGPTPVSPSPPPTTGGASTASGRGFWTAASDGGIFTYGDAPFYGSMGGRPLNESVVGMASSSTGDGYWEVASDGGIFSFGDAPFCGSMGGKPLNRPVVGMATDSSTGGYWEVASDGGIFSFNAPFLGSTGGIRLNEPVVGMAATADGEGYWLVASDGGIFAYGDAVFDGSMGGKPLNAPVTSMAAAPGGGYWLGAADGGVFAFGSATFRGSMGGVPLAQPVISLVPSNPTAGYREVTLGGGVFNFSAPLG